METLKQEVLPDELDREMIGRIMDGKRYMGNGCWQFVNVEESRLNEHEQSNQLVLNGWRR